MPYSRVCAYLHVLAVCAKNGDGVKENSWQKKNENIEDLEHEIVKIYVCRY